MFQLAKGHRPSRPAEWTKSKAIAFIVTFASTGTVTFAAREAGMSRKVAYALERRDFLFARSWDAAKRIAERIHGAETEGNSRRAAAPSTSSIRSVGRLVSSPGPERVDRLRAACRFDGESGLRRISPTLAVRLPRQ